MIMKLEIWIPVVVAIISSLTTFIVSRNKNKKDLDIKSRELLSEDEKQFRADLKAIIGSYKQELQDTRSELRASREEIKELREEIAKLHQINLNLTLENQKLVAKVQELTDILSKLSHHAEKKEVIDDNVVSDFDGFHVE